MTIWLVIGGGLAGVLRQKVTQVQIHILDIYYSSSIFIQPDDPSVQKAIVYYTILQ